MKKGKAVLLVILAIILVALIVAGVVVYKNWNTVSALYYSFTGQSEQVDINKVDTDKRAEEAIKDYGIENIRPLDEEETEKLNSGELTEEEAIKIVLGREDERSDTSTSTENTNENNSSNKVPEPLKGSTDEEIKKKKDEIAELIGKMYVLKAKFSNELSAVESWVHSEYNRVRTANGGTISTAEKWTIGKAAYSRALALEGDCDSQVSAILNRLTVLLEETGQSTKLVSEIRAAYENEKVSAKSLYMSKI